MKPKETTACNATNTDELSDFLSKKQDTTLLDLEWQEKGMNFIDDGGTYDIEKNWSNPHDMKPDLRAQWGKSGKDAIVYTEDVNIPQSIAKKASKDDLMGAFITRTANCLMNAGRTKKEIITAIISRMADADIDRYKTKILASLQNYGSTGRFVVEASGYKNCREAMLDASKSKFKKHFGFIRNCSCKDKITVKNERFSSGGGTFDSLFGSENVRVSSSSYQVCPVSGLRIFAGASDIDAKWAGDTGFDMMNACGSDTEKGSKKIAAISDNPYDGLVALCIELDDAMAPNKNDFSLGQEEKQDLDLSNMPVEIMMDKTAPESMGVDLGGKATGDCGCDMGFSLDNTGGTLDGEVGFDVSQNDDYFSGVTGKNVDLDVAPAEDKISFSSVNLPTSDMNCGVDAKKIMDMSMGTNSNVVADEDYFTTPTGGKIEVEKRLDSPVVEFGLGASSLTQKI
jgi:hypothetical protein